MSSKERAVQLFDAVPEFKIDCVIAYMQGIIAGVGELEEDQMKKPLRHARTRKGWW